MDPDRAADARRTSRRAVALVVFLGVVSLFADMTYEGARSVLGPFLAELGASSVVVGGVAGASELLGYAIRFGSGRAVDRTRHYWATTLAGYAINLLAVPLLALTGGRPARRSSCSSSAQARGSAPRRAT